MNMVVLVGRLTRDPSYNEVQSENGSHHIVSFYLAVPRNYLRKGKRIAVAGELMTGSYKDKETGKTVYTTEVTANRLEFADRKDNGNSRQAPDSDADGFSSVPDGYADELPFR